MEMKEVSAMLHRVVCIINAAIDFEVAVELLRRDKDEIVEALLEAREAVEEPAMFVRCAGCYRLGKDCPNNGRADKRSCELFDPAAAHFTDGEIERRLDGDGGIFTDADLEESGRWLAELGFDGDYISAVHAECRKRGRRLESEGMKQYRLLYAWAETVETDHIEKAEWLGKHNAKLEGLYFISAVPAEQKPRTMRLYNKNTGELIGEIKNPGKMTLEKAILSLGWKTATSEMWERGHECDYFRGEEELWAADIEVRLA